ncbi:MAG: hypothetical protein H6Q89_5634 [Myxococcaceae bacterium]|nr:hypothetical protein [Myxococcaceae bacterium]
MRASEQAAKWTAQATALKNDGYNGSVVARKMIEEHGMPEAAALALVGGLYGKSVNPRSGDTTTAVLTGLGLIALGIAIALTTAALTEAITGGSTAVYVFSLGLFGAGATKTFIALVNAGVKEDLKR